MGQAVIFSVLLYISFNYKKTKQLCLNIICKCLFYIHYNQTTFEQITSTLLDFLVLIQTYFFNKSVHCFSNVNRNKLDKMMAIESEHC